MSSLARVLSPKEWESAELLSPDNAPHVFKIDATTVAKTGLEEERARAEVAAIELVRKETLIPVPEIYNCYLVEATQKWCILMEFVEGDLLENVWDQHDAEWKERIIAQLGDSMSQLRTVKGEFVGSVDGTYCEDQFFQEQSEPHGPFATEAEFHEALIEVLKASEDNPWVDMVAGFIRALPPHDLVLTHSDFAPRNIIVRSNRIVAILDWELSGYYPAYWEYVKAYYRLNWSSGWIKEGAIDRILQPYPIEHAVLLHTREIVW
jgi:aminoglycoside phosphotransferase (APT) family kinase protein